VRLSEGGARGGDERSGERDEDAFVVENLDEGIAVPLGGMGKADGGMGNADSASGNAASSA
jgi:hypothetical protein